MLKRNDFDKMSRCLTAGFQFSLASLAAAVLFLTSLAEASEYGVSEAQIEKMRKDAFLKIEGAYNFVLSPKYQEVRPYLRNEVFVRDVIALSTVALLGLPTGQAIVSAALDDSTCKKLRAGAYILPKEGVLQLPMIICLDWPGGESIIHEWLHYRLQTRNEELVSEIEYLIVMFADFHPTGNRYIKTYPALATYLAQIYRKLHEDAQWFDQLKVGQELQIKETTLVNLRNKKILGNSLADCFITSNSANPPAKKGPQNFSIKATTEIQAAMGRHAEIVLVNKFEQFKIHCLWPDHIPIRLTTFFDIFDHGISVRY